MWKEQWDRLQRFYSLLRENEPTRGWKEQLARAQRWYGRFKNTDSGREHDRESDYYQDEAYAFFQNCYHLKDWLKNDPAVAKQASDVEDFIRKSSNLLLCADICNGSKHLKLKSPRSTKVGKRHFALNLKAGGASQVPPTISAKYEIVSDGTTHDAFALATSCMDEWETYLKQKSLL